MWPLIWGAGAVCVLNLNEERGKERLLIRKALSGPQTEVHGGRSRSCAWVQGHGFLLNQGLASFCLL